MNIQPEYLTLDKLLAGRLFRIPHYQRAYSWKRKQCTDMFDDIKKLKGGSENGSHFMATVVGLHYETTMISDDQYENIEIVDGQQRLTTLVLLLKAIEQKLETSSDSRQNLQKLLVKRDNASLILLQTNHDRSQYFANFLRHGVCPSVEEAQTVADRELLSAIHHCKDFVNSWEDQIELLRIIRHQLTFIFHKIEDEAIVYTVFEVLNNRGLRVAWLDRLKNALMSVAFENNQGNSREHIEELHQIWGQTYETIGLHQALSTEALRFSATLKANSKISRTFGEEAAVRALRAQSKNTAQAIVVSNWLLKVTKTLSKFIEPTKSSGPAVSKIIHARLLAVAISLRNLPSDQEETLLNELAKTTFRIFGLCRKDARTGVGDYVKLAWDTLNDTELDTDDISDRIKKIGEGKDRNTESAARQLKNSNCYRRWEDELRYLLFRYEKYLVEQQGQTLSDKEWNLIWHTSAAQSIEHIQPQSKGSQEPLEANGKGIFVHRLGNLLLLPPNVNSKLSDKDPEEKADSYINTGLLIAKEVGQTIKQSGWSTEQIEEREKQLIEWIQCEWS